jgi:excisionase family DNA binding protein
MKGKLPKNNKSNGGNNMDELEALLTVEEVAKKLRIAESTVYNFINRGVLPAVKMGKAVRLSAHDVSVVLEKLKKRAVGIAA